MGLFSDADIDEAWQFIQTLPELTEDQKLAFIEGFQEGWKKAKEIEPDILQLNPIVKRTYAVSYSKEDLKTNDDFKKFGFQMGVLVAVLKYNPILVFDNMVINWFVNYINSLKEIPEYFEFFKRKISEWNTHIRSQLPQLADNARRRYAYFIERI